MLDVVCFGHLLGAAQRRGRDHRSQGIYAGHLLRCLLILQSLGVTSWQARECARIAIESGKLGDIE